MGRNQQFERCGRWVKTQWMWQQCISRIPLIGVLPLGYEPSVTGRVPGQPGASEPDAEDMAAIRRQMAVRLEQLLRAGAVDAGNGDVLDGSIDAGIAVEQARLDAERIRHLSSIRLMMMRNSGDAEIVGLQLSDAQRQLMQLRQARSEAKGVE